VLAVARTHKQETPKWPTLKNRDGKLGRCERVIVLRDTAVSGAGGLIVKFDSCQPACMVRITT
jgi:hypothetical protein